MREHNGVQIFEPGESVPLPKGLNVDFEVYSPFGFKIVEINGRPTWAVASEEDYRKVVAQLQGIKPDDVKTELPNCHNVSPTMCNPTPTCTFNTQCRLVVSPGSNPPIFVCVCMPAFPG